MTTKQLRQKILDLAIHGRLVPQDANDEPASALLSRIRAEKEQLVADGKLKKKDLASPPVSDEDKPFEVPEGWEWVTVKDVCSKIGSGSTPRGSNYSENGIPFFRSQNVYNYGLVYDDIKYISESTHQSMIGTEVLANDLLLNITGGSLGRCAIVPEDFERGNVSQHVCILRTTMVLPAYLHCFVISNYFAETMILSGSGREGLPKYSLEAMLIPLPPLAEQQRIVAAVEQWMSLVDIIESGKENLQQSIALAKNKILDLAIKGKLVEKESEWEEKMLGEVAVLQNGYAFKSSQYVDEGIRIIRIMNVQDGYIEDESPKFYPLSSLQTIAGFMLNEGDLLMSLTGNVGRVGILDKEMLPAALNQRVACIRATEKLNSQFLYFVFLREAFKREAIENSKGVAQLNMSTEWLKRYTIPLPPLSEQHRIVAKIEELFAQLDNIANALK